MDFVIKIKNNPFNKPNVKKNVQKYLKNKNMLNQLKVSMYHIGIYIIFILNHVFFNFKTQKKLISQL